MRNDDQQVGATSSSQSSEPSINLSAEVKEDSVSGKCILRVQVTAGASDQLQVLPLELTLTVLKSMLDLDPNRELPTTSKNMCPFPECLKTPENWSAWLQRPNIDAVNYLKIVLVNYKKQNGEQVTKYGNLAPGGVCLQVPFKPVQAQAFDYTYRYGKGSSLKTGTLRFELPLVQGSSTMPDVRLYAKIGDQELDNVSALESGSAVDICWKVIEGTWQALSGNLMGPLPFGRSELPLEPGNNYSPAEGKFRVGIASEQTYTLQIILQPPNNGPRIAIIRSLTLSPYSNMKYTALDLTPKAVLPYGPVTAHWVAWGVRKASLEIDFNDSPPIEKEIFMPVDPMVPESACGDYRFNAPKTGTTTVSLLTWTKGNPEESAADANSEQKVPVKEWHYLKIKVQKDDKNVNVPKNILSVAYQPGDKLIFCSGDMLYRADISNLSSKEIVCEPLGDLFPDTKRWLAVASFPADVKPGFVALRVITRGTSEETGLIFFNEKGEQDGEPVTLSTFAGISCGQLVVIRDRIYIIGTVEKGEGGKNFSPARIPVPLSCDRASRLLETEYTLLAAHGSALLNLADRLYTLNQNTGELLRFDRDGTNLGMPKRAQTAPRDDDGRFDVSKGVPLVIEGVLVVIGSGQNKTPLDLVYNARYDSWTTCGHGLAIFNGALAYRGGSSRYLFALGDMRRVASKRNVGPSQVLGIPDHIAMFGGSFRPADGSDRNQNVPLSLINDYLDQSIALPLPVEVVRQEAPAPISSVTLIRSEGDRECNCPFALKPDEAGIELYYSSDHIPVGILGIFTRDEAYWYYAYEVSPGSGKIGLITLPQPAIKELKAQLDGSKLSLIGTVGPTKSDLQSLLSSGLKADQDRVFAYLSKILCPTFTCVATGSKVSISRDSINYNDQDGSLRIELSGSASPRSITGLPSIEYQVEATNLVGASSISFQKVSLFDAAFCELGIDSTEETAELLVVPSGQTAFLTTEGDQSALPARLIKLESIAKVKELIGFDDELFEQDKMSEPPPPGDWLLVTAKPSSQIDIMQLQQAHRFVYGLLTEINAEELAAIDQSLAPFELAVYAIRKLIIEPKAILEVTGKPALLLCESLEICGGGQLAVYVPGNLTTDLLQCGDGSSGSEQFCIGFLGYAGQAGETGLDGGQGASGSAGVDAFVGAQAWNVLKLKDDSRYPTDGGQGIKGLPGQTGSPGEKGMPAPHGKLRVGNLTGRCSLYTAGGTGGDGGRGGNGGKGGQGGRGGKGSWYGLVKTIVHPRPGGMGGAGGDAGRGGDGGDGGPGARVLVHYDQLTDNARFDCTYLNAPGGKGGLPGKPGLPGDGGPGGENLDAPECPPAGNGPQGTESGQLNIPGSDGKPGIQGCILILQGLS